LRLPIVGPCLEAIALARFCLALRLTLDTSLSMPEALRLCLRATGNAAFAAQTEVVGHALRTGEDLSTALADSRLFRDEFVNIVATAEHGGRVPEVMRQQSEYYQEEAERRLRLLTIAAGFGVWLIVAVLIILTIFRIFFTYLGLLDSLTK